MNNPPKWYKVVAIAALVWNLLGCMAYLADRMMTAEDVMKLPPAQQEMHAQRTPLWVSATAVAVWFGAAGSVGLIMRKKWAKPLLILSLLGVIVQDIGLFVMANGLEAGGVAGMILQGLVFIVGVLLVMLASTAIRKGWIPKPA